MIELLLQDPTAWLVVSFAVFIIAAYTFGRKAAAGAIDSEINKIRTQIATAEKLRADASALVAQYQANLQNAQAEADKIISAAKTQAEAIRRQNEQELTDTMARREEMLKHRIAQMERSAIDDIRRYASELAVAATTEIITSKMTGPTAQQLADKSINNISEQIN